MMVVHHIVARKSWNVSVGGRKWELWLLLEAQIAGRSQLRSPLLPSLSVLSTTFAELTIMKEEDHSNDGISTPSHCHLSFDTIYEPRSLQALTQTCACDNRAPERFASRDWLQSPCEATRAIESFSECEWTCYNHGQSLLHTSRLRRRLHEDGYCWLSKREAVLEKIICAE